MATCKFGVRFHTEKLTGNAHFTTALPFHLIDREQEHFSALYSGRQGPWHLETVVFFSSSAEPCSGGSAK